MTNPMALPPAPSPAAATNRDSTGCYYEGNVQLMEARFLELTSSIRALHRSVEDLREFCKHPETAGEADHVVVEAIFENLGVLRKQRRELATIVAKMNQLKAQTNMPDDIRIMVLGDEDDEGGIQSSGAVAPGAGNDGSACDDDAGVYL